MATAQPPKKDWFDNIIDFFFGSTKSVGRTLLILAVIIIVIKRDEIVAALYDLANKTMSAITCLIKDWSPTLFVIFLIIFGLKVLFGKKPPPKKGQ